jgi:hypothetical protein
MQDNTWGRSNGNMGKWLTVILYLLTFGIFGLEYMYDLCTLNDRVSMINTASLNR